VGYRSNVSAVPSESLVRCGEDGGMRPQGIKMVDGRGRISEVKSARFGPVDLELPSCSQRLLLHISRVYATA
jgi:hypothetical protein